MLKKREEIRKRAHDFIFKKIHSSKLIYNTCWEDPDIDRELMKLTENSRITMITSAGCNALAYLLDNPREIHCVDVNPKQNALMHLKIAAIKKLSFEDFFQLFGRGFHEDIDIIFGKIKYSMPEFARRYWEKKLHYFTPTKLKKSFYYHGTAGNVAVVIRHFLNHKKDLRDKIFDILDSNSLDEQKRIYAEIAPEFWSGFIRMLVKNPLVLAMLGVPRQQIQIIKKTYPGGTGAYVQDKIRHVFTEVSMKNNYFWRVYLRGEYSTRCCPDYLKEANFEILRERVDRIYTYNQTISEFLRNNPGDYSHFVLLDHQDWLAAHDLRALEEEWMFIVYNCSENAKVLMRSAAEKFDFIPQMVAPNLKPNMTEASKLHCMDRVGTYAGILFADIL